MEASPSPSSSWLPPARGFIPGCLRLLPSPRLPRTPSLSVLSRIPLSPSSYYCQLSMRRRQEVFEGFGCTLFSLSPFPVHMYSWLTFLLISGRVLALCLCPSPVSLKPGDVFIWHLQPAIPRAPQIQWVWKELWFTLPRPPSVPCYCCVYPMLSTLWL